MGMEFADGEIIIRQGEPGNCMYVILEGQVEVVEELENNRVCLAVRSQGEFFGEAAIFRPEVRSATVRALGRARVLRIDKRNLLQRLQADPSLAFRLVQRLSVRLRDLGAEPFCPTREKS